MNRFRIQSRLSGEGVKGYTSARRPNRLPELREFQVDRRKFLVKSSVVGAGLFGTDAAAPGVLRAAARSDSDSHLNLEEKTRGIYCAPFTVPV